MCVCGVVDVRWVGGWAGGRVGGWGDLEWRGGGVLTATPYCLAVIRRCLWSNFEVALKP